jgi:hypothetical protein
LYLLKNKLALIQLDNNKKNNEKTQKLLMQVLKILLLKTIPLFYYVLKSKMNEEFININFKFFFKK